MRYLALICLLLFSASAEARWHRAETDNFIIYMDDSAEDARELAIQLEQLHHAMRSLNNVTVENSSVKLRVFALMSQRSVQRLTRRSRGLAGYYRADMRGSYMVVPRRDIGFGRFASSSQEVIFHEYCHHFLLQFFPANYPPWFVEGFAEFYSTMRLDDEGRVEIGHPVGARAPSLHLSSWIPMETLFSNEASASEMVYAQGWLFMHYAFFNSEAMQVFRAYLTAMQDGASAREAYDRTFAQTGIDYDRILQEYRDGEMRALAMTLADAPDFAVDVQAMRDQDAQAALLYVQEGTEGIAHARQLIETHPDNAQLHVELARMLIDSGEYEASRIAAEQALALDPDHIEGQIFAGMALYELAWDSGDENSPLWEQARAHIVRANRADPGSAIALYAYYHAFPNDSIRPAIADQGLEAAFNRVPQSPELRRTMVEELLNQRRFDLALRIGVPLMQAGHGEGENRPGQVFMTRLREIVANLQQNENYADSDITDDIGSLYAPPAQNHGAIDNEE